MNTYIIILISIITFNVNSQEIRKYKLYSKIWEFEGNSRKTVPINGGNYDLWKTDSLISVIDTVKIKNYLYSSFNEFRKDYGKSIVKFSDSLSNVCEKFSRTLTKKYAHANNIGNAMECINLLPILLITSTKKVDGDINKIIAETIFDSFVCSDTHMDLLLSETCKTFGIGVTLSKYTFNIVIRGMTKVIQ